MTPPPPPVQGLTTLLPAHRDWLRDIEACCSDARSDRSVNLQEDPLSLADGLFTLITTSNLFLYTNAINASFMTSK